jgi:hypothetical protein
MRLPGITRARVSNEFTRRLRLIAVFVPIGLCGCTTVGVGPERIFTREEDALALKAGFPVPQFDITSVAYRNSFITARMYAIDLEFTTYFSKLTQERQLGTLGGDLALLGLTAATTVVHGAALKTALAAVSTAVVGGRTAVDKDVLVSQTIQVLQSQMEASRLAIKTRIMDKLLDPYWDIRYTVAMGLSDLEDYYRAGTLAGALEALAAAVGNNSQQNKNNLNGVTQNGIPIAPLRPISLSRARFTP